DSDTSPKKKPVQATKGTRLKSKAKVAKLDKKKQPAKKTKAKGLAVLSEAEQLKLATKRSKKYFHMSHASGSGDGVDIQSKVPDEQQQKTSNTDEGTGTIPRVLDVPTYESKNEFPDPKKTNEEHNEEEEEYDDEFNIKEEEKIDDEESMDEEEDDEVTKEQYDDVNVNLGNEDTDMTNANQANNEIASLMVTIAQHATAIPEITLSFTTIFPPPPPFLHPLQQEATPTPTPTTLETTTSLPALLNLTYVFKFNERVFNVEKDVSRIKQVDKQEAQDEKNAYIELVDTSIRALIKEEVISQLPQILPQAVSDFATPVIEKNVTEAAVLTRSSSQPTSTYEAAVSLSEFELTKILIDKMEKNKSYDKADYKKKLYDALSSHQWKKRRKSSKDVESSRDSRSKEKKSSSTSKEASQSQHKSFGKSVHAEEPIYIVEDLGMQQDHEFVTCENDEQLADKEVTKVDWFKKPERPPTLDLDWSDFKRLRLQDIKDMLLLLVQKKLINLIIDERYDLNVALRMFTRRIVIQRRVEDLQLGVESYQKKLNLTKPDTFRSNLRKRTAYTTYSDPKGVIYKDQMNRNRLMRADELHKFSDGMLDDVRSALNDIAKGIRMEYLPMRKWSNLDKKRARVMV
ncbi:hypothetical protein Tco_0138514, partial [Tanacetum coccineum]